MATKQLRLIIAVITLGYLLFGSNPASKALGSAKPAELTIELNRSLGIFNPMTDMAQGGIREVMDPNFWTTLNPFLRRIKTEWVRIDHVFDTNYYEVVRKNSKNELIYNWEPLDQTLKEILASGAKPYLCLSYMPNFMSKTGSPYGPPNDYEQWQELCVELVKHMMERWGLEGLYYEIWNEPDLPGFWKGTLDEYLELYKYAALAIRQTDPTAEIGGPATSQTKWLQPFLSYVKAQALPLDFVSWHNYSFDVDSYSGYIDFVRKLCEELKLPVETELVYSEWNINFNTSGDNDDFYNAAHSAAVLYAFHQKNNIKSLFFMPKDQFSRTELQGQWGAITHNNKPKAVYNMFLAYSRLEGERVLVESNDPSVQAFAVRDHDKFKILFWVYDMMDEFGEQRQIKFSIDLKGTAFANRLLNTSRYLIDSKHSNIFANPEAPGLTLEDKAQVIAGETVEFSFSLENGGVQFIELAL